MDDLKHQLEMIQAELAEALNEIERYERVAAGNYTKQELTDKGDPIQKLAQTYDSYRAYQAQNQDYQRRNYALQDDLMRLKAQLAEALKAVPAKKGTKKKEEPDTLTKSKVDEMYAKLMKDKRSSVENIYTYRTTAGTTGEPIRWDAIPTFRVPTFPDPVAPAPDEDDDPFVDD